MTEARQPTKIKQYFQTEIPVASIDSSGVLLSMCFAEGYTIQQNGVENALLNRDLLEKWYMMPPNGV